MVYHELRSPLTLMVTAARTAAFESEDDAVRERCESIVRAAERMLRTATHIFELASASNASQQTRFCPEAVVRDLVHDYLQMGVPIQLVATEESVNVELWACREHLEALVTSWLSNATDHGEPGGPVQVTLSCSDGALDITIVNRVAPRDTHRGLGLGSYIGDHLARSLGGSISGGTANGLHSARLSLPVASASAVCA